MDNDYNDITKVIEIFLHGFRVGYLSYYIAEELNLNPKLCHEIKTAGYFHDVGKLLLKPEVLYKTQKLNEDERKHIELHPLYSEYIIKSYIYSDIILDGIRHHHESCDGSGYPDKLKKNDISLIARILKVADVYDALISKRIYRDVSYSSKEALEIMEGEVQKYDQIVYAALKSIIDNPKVIYIMYLFNNCFDKILKN
ncbi:HD-GYP domain-containing protein [Vallitalea guaymasensis]|uniref:HD-GYP domain-containing protein n=1 Tax=Vallitalea guaymasensis TaxID=1185412 RepID=UPI000DE4BC32|nr:HD domain-containing phosphohydrolase [Vallitalea guaymasensis]